MANPALQTGVDSMQPDVAGRLSLADSGTQEKIDERVQRSKKSEALKNELKSCKKGQKDKECDYPTIFEHLCEKIIKLVFEPELAPIVCRRERPKRSADGYGHYRTDLVLEVGGLTQLNTNTEYGKWENFWGETNSRQIVFECKNYNEQITEDEVFQVFMYSGVASRMGVIFTRLACNEYDFTEKGTLHSRAFDAIKKLYSLNKDDKWIILVFGDKEIFQLLDAYVDGNLLLFFATQKSIFETHMG